MKKIFNLCLICLMVFLTSCSKKTEEPTVEDSTVLEKKETVENVQENDESDSTAADTSLASVEGTDDSDVTTSTSAVNDDSSVNLQEVDVEQTELEEADSFA